MPTLTRHQKPTIKLPGAWKLILALVILVLLMIFKGLLFRLEKNENEQSAGILRSDETSSAKVSLQPRGNQGIQPIQNPPPTPTLNQSSDSGSGLAQTSSSAPAAAPKSIGKLKILSTPTGSLHVRSSPDTSAPIISQVTAGQTFPYLAQQSGWYQIILPNNQTGWVSGQYITTNLTSVPTIIRRRTDDDGGNE